MPNGFTIVELVVALILLSMITALLVEAIAWGRRARVLIENASASGSVAAVQHALRSYLAQARIRASSADARGGTPGFIGSSERIRFVSSYAPAGQYGGLYDVEIAIEPRPGQPAPRVLSLRQQLVQLTNSNDGPSLGDGLTHDLLTTVRRGRFRFFGSADSSEAPRWHDTWPEPSRLPRLVSINLELDSAETKSWPQLTVHLPLSE